MPTEVIPKPTTADATTSTTTSTAASTTTTENPKTENVSGSETTTTLPSPEVVASSKPENGIATPKPEQTTTQQTTTGIGTVTKTDATTQTVTSTAVATTTATATATTTTLRPATTTTATATRPPPPPPPTLPYLTYHGVVPAGPFEPGAYSAAIRPAVTAPPPPLPPTQPRTTGATTTTTTTTTTAALPHTEVSAADISAVQVGPYDVLCGRGGATNNHNGNRNFRRIVTEHQKKYLAARKRDKRVIAEISGRFLRRESDGRWSEVDGCKACEKTSQALREGLDISREVVNIGGGPAGISRHSLC